MFGGVFIYAIGTYLFSLIVPNITADNPSLLSLELGRPALTKEEDCTVGLPSPIDDRYILEDSNWFTPTLVQSTSALRPLIQVMGGIAQLLQLLKSQQIAPTTLEAYDAHFIRCMATFPPQHQLQRNDYIDPIELPPMIYLQNARIMLHRHNLTPACEPSLRSAAIDSCLLVAKDTANFLRRCMQDSSAVSSSKTTAPNDTWQKRMVAAASAFLCTHIWRCTLFLCFRLEFEIALICVRASAIIGDARPVNTACGRYMEFFLQQLSLKILSNVQLEEDEEMIAYVSADLQGAFDKSWIWQESKGDTHLGTAMPDPLSNIEEPMVHQNSGGPVSEKADSEWNGWESVITLLDQLLRSEQRKKPQPKHEGMAPRVETPVGNNNSNRINIRDLI